MKKIISLVLALAMILMVGAAFAAQTVTIDNASAARRYTFYKVFDVTVGTDSTGATVYSLSYTKNGTNDAFFTELDSAPFDVVTSADGLTKSVSDDKDVTGAALRGWILGSHYPTTVSVVANGTAPTMTASLDDGYYVMIVEETGKNPIASTILVPQYTTIHDKNGTTTLDKQEQIESGDWKYDDAEKASTDAHKEESDVPTAKVGDTVHYKVTGVLTHYIDGKKVTQFSWVDTMSDGLTPVQGENSTPLVNVQINGETVTPSTLTQTTADTGITTTTIIIPTLDANGDFLYDENATYTITYDAIINDNAVQDTGEENDVTLTYSEESGTSAKVDEDDTKVETYNIGLKKVDADDSTRALAGAEFSLYYNAENGGTAMSLYPVLQGDEKVTPSATTNRNTYRTKAEEGVTATTAVTTLIAGADGMIIIQGLDQKGTYWFEETKAPEGFNKLPDRADVTTAKNATNYAEINVENNKGTLLPSTGGIGTTIFYILGGLLVVGAAVILVARRKAQD